MAVAYYYSSTAGLYTLSGAITSSATVITLDSVTGLPGGTPFKMVLDPGQSMEEIVKVTAVAGTSLTVVRAWDGTSAASHAGGASARHMMTAEDFALSRSHEAAINGVHGVTGSVVGTTDAQALTNKNLSDPSNTFSGSIATLTGAQTLTNKNLTDSSNTFPSSLVNLTSAQTLTSKTITGGWVNPSTLQKSGVNVATVSETATLTNKTLDGGSNTFTNIPQSAVTGLATMQTDVNNLQYDTGVVSLTASSAAAPGFTNLSVTARRIGKLAQVYWSADSTNAFSAGDINNTDIATLPAAWWPSVPVSCANGASGNSNSYTFWTTGGISVSATGPGGISAGGHVSGSFTYLVA